MRGVAPQVRGALHTGDELALLQVDLLQLTSGRIASNSLEYPRIGLFSGLKPTSYPRKSAVSGQKLLFQGENGEKSHEIPRPRLPH